MARKLYVHGKWVETGKTFKVYNPYDRSVVDEVFQADEQLIEEAIQSSVEGFEKMRRLSGTERVALLDKVVKLIGERQDDLAMSICLEAGKPIREARTEAARSLLTFTLAKEESGRMIGEMIPLDLNAASVGRFGITRRCPVGPILGISPFNFPLNLVSHKVAPALAVGSAILLKPASYTPITSLILAEIIDEAGFPPGAFNVLCVPGSKAQVLVEDPRFKMITFTGSPDVGWKMKADAGKKKVLLELGGDAACIVDKTADIDNAVQRCLVGAFAYAGQICISIQRLLLEKSIATEFMEKFITGAKALKVGDPRDEDTRVGPMIDENAAKRIEEWVTEAVSMGAELLLGGKRDGRMYSPTILRGVTKAMRIGNDEAFAPIVNIYEWEDFSEALDIVNSSRYGLQAGIFSNDLGRVTRAWEELEVGAVIAGDVPTYRIDNMPYGGVKDSGMGREGLRWAMADMTEERLLVVNPDRK